VTRPAAERYPREIASRHESGLHRDALTEALRWLTAEAVQAERRRPAEAEALYRQLTKQISKLAVAIPAFRASGHGRTHDQ